MHGGTVDKLTKTHGDIGLSPRARGNRLHMGPNDISPGSIPACTGEPCRLLLSGIRGGVYPRVHGGTGPLSSQCRLERGLSPRARGNLPILMVTTITPGSIPACTGEPASEEEIGSSTRVYPRVHGGTSHKVAIS